MIRYKVDLLELLKEKGYSTYRIRREGIFSQSQLQNIRDGKLLTQRCLNKICELLSLQPGDVLEYVPDKEDNMNMLYNGKCVNEENVLEMLKGVDDECLYDDMTEAEKTLIRKVAAQEYDGAEEDLEYLVESLNSKCKYGWNYCQANLQTVYDILSQGNWYYMQK